MTSNANISDRLRVALLAGTLAQGGAEKQLLYIARSLQELGVDVRVYSLTRGEHYEEALHRMDLSPIWVSRSRSPLVRVAGLSRRLRQFRPHVLQGIHFYTNLHVELAARACGAVAIGSIRNDTDRELNANRIWGKRLLFCPRSIIANSAAASRRAVELGRPPDSLHVLPNAIDLQAFDRFAGSVQLPAEALDRIRVAVVCRLVAAKRVDRFLATFARAAHDNPRLHALIVGEGPQRAELEALATRLGLGPSAVSFLGRRNDIPDLLRHVDMLAISSDHEGLPNVALEAMAARIPVISTPAGDASTVVVHNVTGMIVPSDDLSAFAAAISQLADSSQLRSRLGDAGRQRIELLYSYKNLPARLLDCYLAIAQQQNHQKAAIAINLLQKSLLPHPTAPDAISVCMAT